MEEIVRLRRELARAVQESRDTAERIHRQYRRDLVPVRQVPAPFHGPR